MSYKLKHIFIVVLCLFAIACQTSVMPSQNIVESDIDAASLDNDVGSVANNPKLPTKAIKVFPEFENVLNKAGENFNLESVLGFVENANDNLKNDQIKKISLMTQVLKNTVGEFELLESYGNAISLSLDNSKIESATNEIQSLEIEPSLVLSQKSLIKLLGSVDFSYENENSDAMRFYFRNSQTKEINGTYVVSFDDSGNPQKGLFAYVNPAVFSGKAVNGLNSYSRLSMMVFDLSDPEQSLITVRKEVYSTKLKHFVAVHVMFDCDVNQKQCVSEYLDISSKAPLREISESSLRFSWDDNSDYMCVAPVLYAEDSNVVLDSTTYSELGGNSSLISCEQPEPVWTDYLMKPDDFVMRVGDATDVMTDTASLYYGDGTSYDSWNELSLDTIDKWLYDYNFK